MIGCRRRWPNPACSGMRHSRRGAEEDDEVMYVDPNEVTLRDAVPLEEPRAVIHRFATLARESGSDAEWTAAHEIGGRPAPSGAPHTMHAAPMHPSRPQQAPLGGPTPKPQPLRLT